VAKKAVDRLAVYLLAAEKAAQTCPPPLAFQGPGEPRFSDLLLHVSWSAIGHSVGLMGSSVRSRSKLKPMFPADGQNVARTVTENSQTIKFGSHGFEQERCWRVPRPVAWHAV